MYQASDMGTQKWHLPDYPPAGLRDVGGVEYLHGGVLEGAHTLFKHLYSKSSTRKGIDLNEVINRQNVLCYCKKTTLC